MKSEIKSYPNPVSFLPIELDLENISDELRASTLLLFFKGDKLFVKQDINIERWRDQYEQTKAGWFNDVENIIEHACQVDNLKRDKKGRFVELQQYKEKFLLSLDFRMAEPSDIEFLADKTRGKSEKW